MEKLLINKERCKSCALCILACPPKILKIGEEINGQGYFPIVLTDESKCKSCGLCAVVCPDVVFEIYKDAG